MAKKSHLTPVYCQAIMLLLYIHTQPSVTYYDLQWLPWKQPCFYKGPLSIALGYYIIIAHLSLKHYSRIEYKFFLGVVINCLHSFNTFTKFLLWILIDIIKNLSQDKRQRAALRGIILFTQGYKPRLWVRFGNKQQATMDRWRNLNALKHQGHCSDWSSRTGWCGEAWTNKRSSKQKVFELDQRQSFYNQNTHRDFACTFKYIISCVIGLYTLNV